MPKLGKTEESELLIRVLELAPQSSGWPMILECVDATFSCKSFLAEFNADYDPQPRFGGLGPAKNLGSVLRNISTEGGLSALEFLISEASLYYPYCKSTLFEEKTGANRWDMSNGAIHPVNGFDEKRKSRARNGMAALLSNAQGLVSPIWRTDNSTILFSCLFPEHPKDTIDVHVANEAFRRITNALSCGLNVFFKLEAERSAHQLQRVLTSALGKPAVLIDADREILSHTPRGLEKLTATATGVVSRQKLIIKNKLLESVLQEIETEILAHPFKPENALASAGASKSLTRSVIVSNPDDFFVRISVEPIMPPSQGYARAPWFLLQVAETTDLTEDIEHCLQDQFDLSQSEAHLARSLTMTGSLNETIDRLGITKNTAKTHLRRVFEKTGAHTQLQLARLVHRLAQLY